MRMSLFAAAALLVCMVASESHAGPPRRSRRQFQEANCQQCQQCDGRQCRLVTQSREVAPQATGQVTTVASPAPSPASATTATQCAEALDEVNATRAKRGLKPFVHDPLLSQAAYACAKARAASHIHGHLPSDFAYLPSGASAKAAGCGAWYPGEGWGTCCAYDNYTYAGAAWVIGSDGRRYMHLFCR